MKKINSLFALCFLAYSLNAMSMEVSFEEDHSVPLVYVSVSIKSGVVADPAKKLGLTNFLGDMMVRGTKTKTKEQIDLALDQMGAQLNAIIGTEVLTFRGSVLKSQLEPFLKLFGEILTSPSFPEKEIKKLKAETISAISEELSHDAGLASRRFARFLFGSHPYGNPLIGVEKHVDSFTTNDLLSHYRSVMQPERILVLGTGDSQKATLEAWAESLTPRLLDNAKHGAPLPLSAPPIPVANNKGLRVLLVDKPDRTQAQIFIGQFGLKMNEPRYFPLYAANHAFGGGSFQSTLMREVRVKRGWSYGANSAFRFGLQPRSWHVYLFPASKDAPQAAKLALDLVRDLHDKGVTEADFESSKKSLINGSGFNYNTAKKRTENRMTEKNLGLPEGFFRSYASELQKVSLDAANSAMRSFVDPDNLAIVVLGTASSLKEPLAKALDISPRQIAVVPYQQE